MLNSGNFNVENYNTVEEINNLYDVLGYFGIDSYIKILNEHVYWLEINKIPYNIDSKKDIFQSNIIANISTNTKLSQDFFEKHIDIVNWDKLCKNTNLSDSFFERYIHSLNWFSLCQNTNISESFFEKHIHRVNWVGLCQNTNISEAFFEKHIDMVNWILLCENTNISEDFFEKYINRIHLHWYSLYFRCCIDGCLWHHDWWMGI